MGRRRLLKQATPRYGRAERCVFHFEQANRGAGGSEADCDELTGIIACLSRACGHDNSSHFAPPDNEDAKYDALMLRR
jgi:hypothetical protein